MCLILFYVLIIVDRRKRINLRWRFPVKIEINIEQIDSFCTWTSLVYHDRPVSEIFIFAMRRVKRWLGYLGKGIVETLLFEVQMLCI